MFAQQLFLVFAFLAIAANAQPHFDKPKYYITLTDCRAPQNDLGVIRLLGANSTDRVIRFGNYMREITLASQQFDANNATVVVRPAYPDSCRLRFADLHACQSIYASSDGHTRLARARLCITLSCKTRGAVHWPQPALHFDVPDCRVGQLIGRTAPVGGSSAYEYHIDNANIDLHCTNSSAVLRVKSYLGTFSGQLNFTLSAAETQRRFILPTIYVKTSAVAHIHCNVTTQAPRFDRHQYNIPLYHCLPSETRSIGKLSVIGGESPITYSFTGSSRTSDYHLNATTGELYLAKLLDPYWYTEKPYADLTVRAVDAVGRSTNAKVHVDETCDQDPPVRFTKQYYQFVFSNCSSRADDEAIGRVEATGNSSYHYKFRARINRCDMVEVKLNSGSVTFGPELCHEHPNPCCYQGETYYGWVTLADTRSGRPASRMAHLEVTNAC